MCLDIKTVEVITQSAASSSSACSGERAHPWIKRPAFVVHQVLSNKSGKEIRCVPWVDRFVEHMLETAVTAEVTRP